MKKKLLIVSLVVFMLLLSSLFTEVLNANCWICYGGHCEHAEYAGYTNCEENHGPLSMCFTWGGGCFAN